MFFRVPTYYIHSAPKGTRTLTYISTLDPKSSAAS